MDQRQLVNSLRARKAHVTTKEKSLTEALEALQADSPAIIVSRLKDSLGKFEAAVKGVDDTYLRLEELQGDDQTYQEWSAKHSDYIKPKEEKIAEAVQRISAWEQAAYAAHAQAIRDSPRQGVQPGPREPQAKAVDALRPDVLEEDTGHLAFSTFKDKYRRYYNASNFSVLTRPQQQAYLLSVLSDSLALRINLEDTDSLDTCLAKLTQVFDQRYPWIKKLMDCLNYKQVAPLHPLQLAHSPLQERL